MFWRVVVCVTFILCIFELRAGKVGSRKMGWIGRGAGGFWQQIEKNKRVAKKGTYETKPPATRPHMSENIIYFVLLPLSACFRRKMGSKGSIKRSRSSSQGRQDCVAHVLGQAACIGQFGG